MNDVKQLATALNYPVFDMTGHGRLEFPDNRKRKTPGLRGLSGQSRTLPDSDLVVKSRGKKSYSQSYSHRPKILQL